MKKFKTVLTAIVMLFTFTAFATEPVKVSTVVKAAFKSDFAKATQVVWDKTEDFYFASFTLNNLSVDAAYTNDGELVGMSRIISKQLVPLSVSLAIAEKYDEYQVEESVVELTFEGVTRYYVTVSNESQKLKLNCNIYGEIEVDKKTKLKG